MHKILLNCSRERKFKWDPGEGFARAEKEFMVTTFLREKHGWGLLPQVEWGLWRDFD